MPDIENPQTYSEWYWRNSVDAQRARATQFENAYSPVISRILAQSGLLDIVPDAFKPLFDIVSKPPDPDWDDIQRMFLGVISRAVSTVAGDEMARPFQYEAAEKLLTMRIDPITATTLKQRRKITDELFNGRMHSGGYADSEIEHYYNAQKPYPAMADIIAYARYNGPADAPKELAWSLYDISPTDWPMWEWLSRQKLNTEQVLRLYREEWWSDENIDTELARLGWQLDDRRAIRNLAYDIPNSMLLTQGGLMQNVSEDVLIKNIQIGGIHPHFAEMYLEGILTKPASTDIIAYELRKDPSLSNLPNELRKIGIHPAYAGLYKELAYQIPPVADIITMAVREAFTPDIAQRFGQYEGLPTQYVEWVQKKGLSKEWAERYWAAHWSLPSPQQGFEMLHRGIISRDELSLLLRALDIMPFWRDKLMAMSYRTLTRVDVRRMYAIGVLPVDGVRRAYLDLGYNDYNANLMTQFTVKLTEQAEQRVREAAAKVAIAAPSTWTTSQTLTFLKNGLIDTERARQELTMLGYNPERIQIYLTSVAKPAA